MKCSFMINTQLIKFIYFSVKKSFYRITKNVSAFTLRIRPKNCSPLIYDFLPVKGLLQNETTCKWSRKKRVSLITNFKAKLLSKASCSHRAAINAADRKNTKINWLLNSFPCQRWLRYKSLLFHDVNWCGIDLFI